MHSNERSPLLVRINGSQVPLDSIPVKLLNTRLDRYIREFAEETKSNKLQLNIIFGETSAPNPYEQEKSEKNEKINNNLTENYIPTDPHFTMNRLVFSKKIRDDLEIALRKIRDHDHIYNNWGLSEIDKNPKAAINLFGPPGTGKTAAAHAMAAELNKKIIIASYADIESKYHGEGPKNVQAIFKSAANNNAVLFIDEADSLLSQRLSNVTQGSEQAINSIRSQLLINMESHKGLIVFATNFAKNYDQAFDTRLVHVNIPMPNYEERIEIIKKHLPEKLPRTDDFSIESIAEVEEVCGRDIKNAIISAAVQTHIESSEKVSSNTIKWHLAKEIENRKVLRESQERQLTTTEKAELTEKIKDKLKNT